MRTVLQNIKSRDPDLEITSISEEADNSFTGYFRSKSTKVVRGFVVLIKSYSSDKEAQDGLQRHLALIPAHPDKNEQYKGVTLYRWSRYGGFACQVANHVIDIKPSSAATDEMAIAALESILQDLAQLKPSKS